MEAIDAAELVNLDDKMPVTLLAKTEGDQGAMLQRLQAPGYHHRFVTLAPYIDQSSYRIAPSFSLERGFNLFRAMGLSHICVVNKNNEVVGILTRKDLTNINIYRKLEKLKEAREAALREDEEGGNGGGGNGNGTAPALARTSSWSLRGGGSNVSGSGSNMGRSQQPQDPVLQASHSQAIALAGLDQGIVI